MVQHFFFNNLYFYYAIIEHIRLEKNSEEVLPPTPKQKQKKQKINVGLIKYKPPSLKSTLVLSKVVRQW